MPTVIEGGGAAAGLRFAIVRSRFNEEVTKRLLEGALDALRKGGTRDEAIDVVFVPGAFEIPLVASRLARSRRYDAIICLGAVIRGETPHFEYISAEVSRGIARVSYEYGIPVIFCVLTTDTEEQAHARSGGPREGARLGAPGAGGCEQVGARPTGEEPVPAGSGRVGATGKDSVLAESGWAGAKAPGAGGCNKGYEAGLAAIEMANLMKKLSPPPSPSRGRGREGGRSSPKLSRRKRSR
jgi:6,7-dimethyl-8-ribityllumazine synthase